MTKAALVLGVDPGSTTGLALVALDEGEPQAVWSDQLPWDEACDELSRRLEMLRSVRERNDSKVAVACERFTVNAKTAQRGQDGALDAIGMIGVARHICRLTNVEMAPLQQASAAKGMVNNDSLRRLGLYAPGMVHACDAYRHAVLLAVQRKWLDPRLLLPVGGAR